MPTAEARVETTRAARYLAQLCDHLGHLVAGRFAARHAGSGPLVVRSVDRSGTRAVIEFESARCTLTASAMALTVELEADDLDDLTTTQLLISRRLETIGARDHLVVNW